MAESVSTGLLSPEQVAGQSPMRRSGNGVAFTSFGDHRVEPQELTRLVESVPVGIARAIERSAYFFVPLALSRQACRTPQQTSSVSMEGQSDEDTLVAPVFTSELGEQATCHRNVMLGETDAVFISTRLLADRFALSFEFFIHIGHAFVDASGVPESFVALAWKQAVDATRGETSQDAWEARGRALAAGPGGPFDEKARTEFLEAAFADSIAIYLLSLTVDFDYSELREREYPLLAPVALAERLRHVAALFPPDAGYEFAIRYRRRA